MNLKAATKDQALMAQILLTVAAVTYRPTIWNEAKENWETISSHNDFTLYTKAVNRAKEINEGELKTGQVVKFETKSGFKYQVWAD